MMRYLKLACLGLAAVFFNTSALADVMPLPGGPKLSDCGKARDPARCEARIQARQACSDKRGDNKRMCMAAYVVSPDCARSENPKRCIAQRNAEQACHGKLGKAHKNCVQEALRKKPKVAKPAAPTKPAAGPSASARKSGSGIS
jgi:hypothetical protein